MKESKSFQTFLRQWEMLRNIPRYPRKISSKEMKYRLRDAGFPEVSLRTIQRDLDRFSASFPLLCDENKPIGWSWERDAKVIDVPTLSPHMALTFQLISKFSTNYLPATTIDFLKPYFSLSEKVLDNLTENALTKWTDKIRTLPSWSPTIPPQHSENILRDFYTALLEERKISAVYRKRGAKKGKQYDINPLGLVIKGTIFYLICTYAEDPTLNDLRTFSLHRFESATIIDDSSIMPDGFDLDEQIKKGKFDYSDGSKIKVQLLFDSEAAYHLHETPISLDQKLTERDDGKTLLKATIFNSDPMRWWLLGFGNRVEVLKPVSLRKELISTIDGMRENYG